MEKSADALRTISEVAEELDVPKHVLRFWESKFAHINPMKRGGGRRYYRPADIELLRGIQRLLYGEGYTIRGVQQILKREGIEHVKAIARGDVNITAEQGTGKAKSNSRTGKKGKQQITVDPAVLANIMNELEECRRILHQD